MDSLTDEVRELYMQYPFPNAEYKLDYGVHLHYYFAKKRSKGKKSFLEGIDILEAGCGTGSNITPLSQQFPTSRFLGIDLTPASIKIAKEKAEKLEIKNLDFQIANILELDLNKDFDVIFNLGVLHHLADMQEGIKNLAKHLRSNGYLVLWLYGTYGRFRLNLIQRMFKILLKSKKTMPEKVALAKKALSSLPREYVECHFNAPNTEIEDDFEKSLEFAFNNEAWLVDQFLHVNEKTVNIEDIFGLLDGADLKLTQWLGVGDHLKSYTDQQELSELFDGLEERERLICIDLLIKPNYYLVVAEKKNK